MKPHRWMMAVEGTKNNISKKWAQDAKLALSIWLQPAES
jgi:hypothetical protein